MPPAYSPGVPLWTEGSTLPFSCEDELNSAKKEQELKPCTKFFLCHTVMAILFGRHYGRILSKNRLLPMFTSY